MEKVGLKYSDLSVDAIKQRHRESGGVIVELSPAPGEILRSLLNRRDCVERDLLSNASFISLFWNYCVWFLNELRARLFYKRLLMLQHYASAVDATFGWEINRDGQYLFVLLPISKNHPTKSDEPTREELT